MQYRSCTGDDVSQVIDSSERVHVYKFRICGTVVRLHDGIGPCQGSLCGHAVRYRLSKGTVPWPPVTIRRYRNARSRASLAVSMGCGMHLGFELQAFVLLLSIVWFQDNEGILHIQILVSLRSVAVVTVTAGWLRSPGLYTWILISALILTKYMCIMNRNWKACLLLFANSERYLCVEVHTG